VSSDKKSLELSSELEAADVADVVVVDVAPVLISELIGVVVAGVVETDDIGGLLI